MMRSLLFTIALSFLSLFGTNQAFASGAGCGTYMKDGAEHHYECSKAPVNLTDTASLQRGAATFITYCLGCHSAKYVRYSRLANDLNIDPELAQRFMNFTSDKVGDTLTARIDPELQKKWFGSAPPDLSLETRFKSPDWVYTYLLSFYPDESRPWGVNNTVFKDVAMPDVLHSLKKDLGEDAYRERVGDLVNFMAYIGEPVAHQRKVIGFFVILFLLVLLIPVYLLNREFWKDIH